MSKNQAKDSTNESKGKDKSKDAAGKRADSERKDKTEKPGQGGKDRAVLADVNGDSKRSKQ